MTSIQIIDIDIELNQFNDGEKYISALESIGYTSQGTNILPDRYYFTKGEPRTHQIHMNQHGNKYLLEHLTFRDYLRENPKAKDDYEKLKFKLSNLNNKNKYKFSEE